MDTNVLSELTRKPPDSSVVAYVGRQRNSWISTVTLHELTYGIERLPAGRRKQDLHDAVQSLLEGYADRIISVGPDEAHAAAVLRVQAERHGETLHLADALIAATAQIHALTLVTRNVADFAATGIAVLNPWETND